VQLSTSVAFAKPDLRTDYIGSLAMPHLVSFRSPVAFGRRWLSVAGGFRSPVAGLPLNHWR
jgi:hypothetical protein